MLMDPLDELQAPRPIRNVDVAQQGFESRGILVGSGIGLAMIRLTRRVAPTTQDTLFAGRQRKG
jgi:hypothetical protein